MVYKVVSLIGRTRDREAGREKRNERPTLKKSKIFGKDRTV
jgi:hypothetical protein